MEPVELADLMRRAGDGDRAAWNAIVDEYGILLWSVVRGFRLGEAQAADAVQTTWLRLVEHIDKIRDPARLPGWLRTTAHRVCVDAIRESGRERPVESHHESTHAVTGLFRDLAEDAPEASALRHEREELVRGALAGLPERHRLLLTMLVASPPLSYEEIGARLGMPIGSIGPTRARVLGRLRDVLDAADFHDLALG
ncbi:MAG: polymerase, sigma-24 subunit, subfamily [Mycobacterium sp.]|nr:polymerase, sigma-24 subunit, subfamily [Mycobacterium sp.]